MNTTPAQIIARARFDMARAAMLREMAAYVAQAAADEVDGEIEATGRAMRQMQVVAR